MIATSLLYISDLCTKLAFPDNELTLGAMKKCRDLVGHLLMSSQATSILRSKQGKHPLNAIQDVTTRWWSTYAMLDRMVRENLLLPTLNMSTEQGAIVEVVCAILKPFKNVQLVMEGEKYVTGGLIPGALYIS